MFWRGEDQDDADLVAKFKATGDTRHFAALFDRYQKRIYWIAYSIFKNREIAEDLIQETFVKAFEQIASFDEQDSKSNFYAWLCRICRNTCLDEVRKFRVRDEYQKECQAKVLPLATGGSRLFEGQLNASGEGYRTQELSVIFRQLDEELVKAPEEKRTCWLLFYLEGYSYKEIADKSGFTFEEVKTHIQWVNRQLRRKFK
jgi:RNA polymerase sigma-70 factor (ECF subfamily)